MREEISSLDLTALMKELEAIEGARIDKIYQKNRELIIHFYKPGDKKYRLVMGPGEVYLTKYKRKMPEKPPNFCMFLRRHLGGRYVTKIKQKGFDRIIEIHTEEYALIGELFGDDNFILINKENRKIVSALESREWKDRSIFKGEEYKYPEPSLDPSVIEIDNFKKINDLDRELVRVLASDLGLGGLYSEEICYRSSLKKDKICSELNNEQIRQIFQETKKFVEVFQKGAKSPEVVIKKDDSGSDLIAASPVPLEKYEREDYETKQFENFSQALDFYITNKKRRQNEKKSREAYKNKKEDLEHRKRQQKEKLKGLKRSIEENQLKGDIIYRNYSVLENVIDTLKKAQKKYSEKEIREKLNKEREENVPEAEVIEDVNFSNKRVIVRPESEEFEANGETHEVKNIGLDYSKGLEKNAEDYYEKSKKSEEKVEGVKTALNQTKQELDNLEEKDDFKTSDSFKNKEKAKKEKKWYEKFRWFLSSDNFLVIAGRDATQNDIIVKKYAENNDLLFHTDIPGAPFVVVKSKEKQISDLTLKEAGIFGVSYSSAWKKGIGSADIYWVRPEQAVKVSGLPKGAFQIQGDRTYLRNLELGLYIGVLDRNGNPVPMAGPPSAVKKHCDRFIELKSGRRKKSDVAKEIKSFFEQKREINFDLDKIIRALPPGKSDIRRKQG